MAIREQLDEVERTIGFRYPSSFAAKVEELSRLLATKRFRRAFSDTRLLLSAPDITAARDHIPGAFLPFMREEQPSWPDIYAFDLGSDGPEFHVVIWSDHAVVMDWADFAVFLEWIYEQISKHGKA